MTTGFWRDRPTFVTGATGLVGGWLVKRLVAAGADVVCLVRDWVPQSVLVCDRLWDRVRVVRGDVTDQPLLERALGEYEIETVIHLAAQTIVGIANRNPVSTFFFSVEGDSMQGAEIFDGDILVVDKSIRPKHGHIVLAVVNNEYTVKRLYSLNGVIELHAENPAYAPMRFQEHDELQVWGVVTGAVSRFAV